MSTQPTAALQTPSIQSGSATQPIFGEGLRDTGQGDISWEVSDGELPDDPIVEESQKEEPQEKPSEDKEPELEAQDTTEPDNEEDEDKEPKKRIRNRIPPAKRIADITRQKKQVEYLNQNLLREKEELQKQLLVEQKAKNDAQITAIKNSRDQLQYYLNQAIEDGDSAEQAKLTAQLSEYQAELRIRERETHNVANAQPDNRPQQQYQEEQYNIPEDHPYKDVGDEWVKKNTWADPKSKDFDKEMYEDADSYSHSLVKQYKLEGRGEEVGSPEFFEEITDYIKDSYSLPTRPAPKPKQKEPMQMQNPGSNVASVNRPAANAETARKQNEIVLTKEEKQIAHTMRGSIKDANGNKIYDNRQLEEAYKKYLRR